MRNGIMVGGAGIVVGEFRDGLWAVDSKQTVCHEQLITTGIYPQAVRGHFRPAEGWTNVEEMGEDPLEMECALLFPGALEKPADTTWYILVRKNGDGGYDTITLSPAKDYDEAFCTLAVGEWSQKIITHIKMGDGSEREVFFRCKLLELSDGEDDFRLYITALNATSGWSSPPEIAKELVSKEGIFGPGGGVLGYSMDWFDLDTYVEINEFHDIWLGDAAATLLSKHDWDLFFMHSHPPDWAYHMIITDLNPDTCKDKAAGEKAWEAHLKIYQSQDRMLAQILEATDKETLVILVSDHGATPDGPSFDPYQALVPAGLATLSKTVDSGDEGYKKKLLEATGMQHRLDLKNTKAIPQRLIYVYVNLKGRDPEGIVDPEDYEKVQQEIIDSLLLYVDPETGKRPVALALSKRDARILGLYEDAIGDVIYALYPWFGGQHGMILPTAEWGIGSLKGLLTMTGPGMKKGHRLKRTVWLTDIVPTICYLLDLPFPEQAEGSVIYQAFKDPNFKLKEIKKLKDGLARMETALTRQSREPWDKIDCA
jgi:hypothetical protein